MTEFTNGYFTMMKAILKNHENARKTDKTARFPFSDGYISAYHAWQQTVEYGCEIFQIRDLPWVSGIHDFVRCMKEAGITEIAVTDSSTGLMECLHKLEEEGCTVLGLCKVTETTEYGAETEVKEIRGIRVRI